MTKKKRKKISRIAVFILLTFLSGNIAAQEKKNTYTLNGAINMDTGSIRLLCYLSNEFYPDDSAFKETVIDHGKFTFTGITSYPRPFRLQTIQGYLSGIFYIEPGSQMIVCDKDSIRITPAIANKSTKEYTGIYRSSFKPYHREQERAYDNYDSLREVYKGYMPGDVLRNRDVQLKLLQAKYLKTSVTYIKRRPDSYVALTQLDGVLQWGYSPVYDTIYTQFSSKIKHSYAGKVLNRRLKAAKNVSIGKVFPNIAVLDTGLIQQQLPLTNGSHKYTLIDFWFSHCGPCLSQFAKFKKIYDRYKNNGLQIIGISTDNNTAINDWKKVIREKQLTWLQYLDEGGQLANSLVINTFPRNFLLDEHNVIVKRDITPEELEQLMK